MIICDFSKNKRNLVYAIVCLTTDFKENRIKKNYPEIQRRQNFAIVDYNLDSFYDGKADCRHDFRVLLVCVTLTELKYESRGQIKNVFSDPINFSGIIKISKMWRLNQLTIKIHFTVATTNFVRQEEVVLMLDIEIIDFLIGPNMLERLENIQIDQVTVRDLEEKLTL